MWRHNLRYVAKKESYKDLYGVKKIMERIIVTRQKFSIKL